MNELEKFILVGELYNKGYICISNRYLIAGRIDRDDWLDFLAGYIGCAVADFYKKDGSGVSNSWREHYIRVHSKDKITLDPEIYNLLKRQHKFLG